MRRSPHSTLVALCGLSLLLPAAAAAADPPAVFDCGRDWRVTRHHGTLPADAPLRAAAAETTGTTIVLNAGPGLTAVPAALAAWERAADTWESWLTDDVTIVIDADLESLGEGILGGTNLFFLDYTYDVMRDALVADADSTDSLALGLPTGAQLGTLVPPGGWFFSGSATATKANLRALGFDVSADPNPDAEISFNSDYLSLFDFDDSDGIDSTGFDFEAIVLHEMGHALGFHSQVDIVDLVLYLFPGFPGAPYIGPLDYYRLLPGAGDVDFTLAPRVLATGIDYPDQVTYVGDGEYAMSTAAYNGDGYQASHWKADELSGTFIGLMDPSIAPGVHEEITPADIRALSLIGWDTVPDCDGDGIPGGVCDSLVVAVGDGFAPAALPLRAFPNPFRAGTTVLLRLAEAAPVRVSVHDMAGREVAVLASGSLAPGEHPLAWDGRNSAGTRVGAGVYAVRARVGETVTTAKVLRIP